MKKGKMSSQVAHAALGNILQRMSSMGMVGPGGTTMRRTLITKKDSAEEIWLSEAFTKIVVGVENLEEMLALKQSADDAGLITCLITDNGDTVFTEPTVTTLSIGPALSSELYPVTGHLRTI